MLGSVAALPFGCLASAMVWMLGFGGGLDAWLRFWLWLWFGCSALALALAVVWMLGFANTHKDTPNTVYNDQQL